MANIILDDSVLRDFGGRTVKQVLKGHESKTSRKIACIGDSINAGATGGSWYEIMVRKYGFEFINKGNFAIGGKTSQEIIDEQLDDALASGADVIVMGAGANDIGAVSAYNSLTLKNNIEYIWDTIQAAGIEVIDTSLVPCDYTDGNRDKEHVNINYWRKQRCRQRGITHIDFFELVTNKDGHWASTMGSDQLHPSWKATHLMAAHARDVILNGTTRPFLAEIDDLNYAGRPFTNAISYGSAAGTPSGYYTTGTGGTVSIQSPDAGTLGSWMRVTCASAASAAINNSEKELVTLGYEQGDRIALGCKLRTNGNINLSIIYTGGTTVVEQPMWQYSFPTSGATYDLYHETAIVSAAQYLGVRFFADGTGYFEINRPVLINLTKQGLDE